MVHQFQTRHPEFAGFSEYYAERIRPELIARDGARRAAVKRAMRTALASSGALMAAGGYLSYSTGAPNWAIWSVMGALAVGGGVWRYFTKSIRAETKSRLVEAVLGHVGWRFDAFVGSFDTQPFESLFLLPGKFNRARFEDAITGEAHGAAFRSTEAHLERETRDSKGNKHYKTVFRGQLMTLDFPTRVFGRTVVLRDKGMFNRKARGDMKRVGLVDPTFEKLFEAYSTDQVEGRVILDPVFMQAMLDLEASVSGRNIRFGFDDDTLFIAVETPNQFEAGPMTRSLDDPAPTQKIIDEVGLLFDIADKLQLRKQVEFGRRKRA